MLRIVNFNLLILFCFFANAQTAKVSFNLKQIEESNNYPQNICALENELKKTSLTNDLYLDLQTLLINNYIQLFKYDKASQFCQKQIIIAKQNKLHFNEATLYLALVKIYYYLNQVDKVILYNDKCLKIATTNNYFRLLKRCNHNLGVIAFEKEHNYKLAELYFLKAIKYGQKTPSNCKDNLGQQYRLLATTNDLLGRYKRADSLFNITTSIYKLCNDSAGIAEALIFHARLFNSIKQYNKAISLINEAIFISKSIKNSLSTQTALSIYENIQFDAGNYKEAYLAAIERLNMQTAKGIDNLKKEIADSEAKFRIAELQNKQELMELQTRQNKQKDFYAFLIIFLIAIFLIILFYQKKMSKKEQALKLKNQSDVYYAEEKERLRIAQDLHDNMGAYATSMLAQIDKMEMPPFSTKNEKIKGLRVDAENIMATLRETIWILKTKTITVSQFFELVKIYANKNLAENLQVSVTYKEDVAMLAFLKPTVSLNLYRIIQEIIQNIIKHSKAKNIEFILVSHNKLILDITDDGVGFDLDNLLRKSGLDNIEFRANEINYFVEVKSNANFGTKIRLIEK